MIRTKQRRTHNNAVNAGSMADIAFLLLIFFLVTTTILMDKGILVKLPPWAPVPPFEIDEARVLTVNVNAQDQLLVEGKRMTTDHLRETTKGFIHNYLQSHQATDSKPLVSLQNDRGTSYQMYIEVYNELKAAYSELWEEKSKSLYGKPYADLSGHRQKEIRLAIPLIISEAEPTELMLNQE
ncbi:MAG: biopolymer transporter ExbD [Bacteroidota bacterium]